VGQVLIVGSETRCAENGRGETKLAHVGMRPRYWLSFNKSCR
jgi:hypothetical protein